ncbi:MAG TPA: DUF885 domain-containing protein [Vicinamibacteria bacterium]
MTVDLEGGCRSIVEARGRQPDGERLQRLLDLHWQYMMVEYPEFATYVGHPGQDHRWTDLSLQAVERRRRELDLPAHALASIDREALGPADRLNFDLFKRGVDEAIEGRRFRGELMPINQMGGVQQDVARLLVMMQPRDKAGFENVISRLEGVAPLVDQNIALMDEGLRAGLTPPRITLRDVPEQVKNQIVDDPAQSPMLGAFARMPETIDAAEAERLREKARAAYSARVAPAFQKLQAWLAETYIPRARETIALRDLPDGEAWYAWSVKQSTTTERTPRQIHDTGVAEVARIHGEMDKALAATGFAGMLPEFMQFLRSDPQFFFERPEQLLAAYRDIAKRADPELVRLFKTLPRLPYGVVAVPAYAEKSQTTAYYEPGSPEAGRPGKFYANTYDLRSRPKWEMEALTLHEAVPGHHLQIAIAQELPELPPFRRHGFYTAYVEGWGLYAESLGSEMGFYSDPYARFGQLTYEMWRAIRLVVDTGIHAFGWSRQQAIDYFVEHAGKAEHDIVVEVDRYIVWPAQALAYKVGELKIKDLRAFATAALGERFDVRAFHDLLLGQGALPLDVLESRVRNWVRGQPPTA